MQSRICVVVAGVVAYFLTFCSALSEDSKSLNTSTFLEAERPPDPWIWYSDEATLKFTAKGYHGPHLKFDLADQFTFGLLQFLCNSASHTNLHDIVHHFCLLRRRHCIAVLVIRTSTTPGRSQLLPLRIITGLTSSSNWPPKARL